MSDLVVAADQAGQTLAAFVRQHRPGLSWSQARQLVESRRVRLNRELWLDPARRLKDGDVVELLDRPERMPEAFTDDIVIRHLDEHIIVAEKPSGISTVRHPAEREWEEDRRKLVPTLDDRLHRAIAGRLQRSLRDVPKLRKVHRLDKLTSGLVAFARSPLAERELGRQFAAHTIDRHYLAIVHGTIAPQTIRTWLQRDRGDGRRGSGAEGIGKVAITHLQKVEPIGAYSLVTCRLETGRTHQIRIHLAEIGHPVCGDPVYIIRRDGSRFADASAVPRMALHAAELGFVHPATHEKMHWQMPLPTDLKAWMQRWT